MSIQLLRPLFCCCRLLQQLLYDHRSSYKELCGRTIMKSHSCKILSMSASISEWILSSWLVAFLKHGLICYWRKSLILAVIWLAPNRKFWHFLMKTFDTERHLTYQCSNIVCSIHCISWFPTSTKCWQTSGISQTTNQENHWKQQHLHFHHFLRCRKNDRLRLLESTIVQQPVTSNP